MQILNRVVGAARFELTTPCAQGRCATRLRYAPISTRKVKRPEAWFRSYTDLAESRKLVGIAEERMPHQRARLEPELPGTA